MERKLFGFKPANLSTVEFAYNTDLSLDCYYFLVDRNDYPCKIYVKVELDGSIKEIYPVYIDSMRKSIDIIKGSIPYNGDYDYDKYAYMSWDMKNDPTEIYIPKGDYIEKFKEDKLNAQYYTVYNLKDLDNHELLTNEIKDFVRKEKPTFFMYVIKNGELKRFCNIFNFKNKKYIEKRNIIPAIKDKWLD